MKKTLFIVWCCQFLVFILLTVNIISNFRMIVHYRDGVYKERDVSVLGLIEPYKYYYNKGNIYFKNREFDNAAVSYRKSLNCRIPEGDECSVRINLALSMVTPLDLDNITDDNIDEIIRTLEDARDILVEEGCAHMNDEDGHSEDAQTLKDEIDEWLDRLNNQNTVEPTSPENQTPENETPSESESQTSEKETQPESESQTSEKETQPESESQTSENETQTENESQSENETSEQQTSEEETTEDPMEELERKLKELEQQGMSERGQHLENYKNYGNYEYYDGDCW